MEGNEIGRLDRIEIKIDELTRLVKLAIPQEIITAINRQDMAYKEWELLNTKDNKEK